MKILELNVYRIEKFGLARCFPVFFSSCFLGVRKPDEEIYRWFCRLLSARHRNVSSSTIGR